MNTADNSCRRWLKNVTIFGVTGLAACAVIIVAYYLVTGRGPTAGDSIARVVVERLGGRLEPRISQSPVALYLNGEHIGDDDVSKLLSQDLGLQSLVHLDLSNSSVTDDSLPLIAQLPRMEVLVLSGSFVSGSGSGVLCSASKLNSLFMSHNRLQTGSFEWLARCRHLRQLDVSYTNLSDDDLLTISSAEQITYLNCAHTDVSDTGLEHLERLRGLKYLNVAGTKVSSSASEKLQQMLPDLRLVR